MGTTLIQFTRSYMHGRTTTTRVYCSWLFNTGVILLIFGLIVTVLPFLAGYYDEYRSLDLSGLFYLGLMIIIVSFGFLLCFHITNIVVIDDLEIPSVIRAFDGDACNLTRIRKMESISNRRINRLDSAATDDEGCDNFV